MTEKVTENLELLEVTGYSKKAIDLYRNRVNVGVVEDADVALAYTGPCGDTLKLYLKINKDTVIKDAKFQYVGCPALAICGSILTQIVSGKTLREAKTTTEDDVLKELNGLPDEECHCAELAVTTLYKTITKYETNSVQIPENR